MTLLPSETEWAAGQREPEDQVEDGVDAKRGQLADGD
jgi:hypothetical protein